VLGLAGRVGEPVGHRCAERFDKALVERIVYLLRHQRALSKPKDVLSAPVRIRPEFRLRSQILKIRMHSTRVVIVRPANGLWRREMGTMPLNGNAMENSFPQCTEVFRAGRCTRSR